MAANNATLSTDRLDEMVAVLGDGSIRDALTDDELASLRAELRDMALAVRDRRFAVGDPIGMLSLIADHYEGIEWVLACRQDQRAQVEARLGLSDAVTQSVGPRGATLPALGTMTPPASHAPVVTGGTARLERLGDRTAVSFDELVGDTINALDLLAREASETGDRIGRRMPLARLAIPFPEDRRLDNNSLAPAAYNARLSAVMRDAWDPARWDDALVASGGFSAPAMPSYEVPHVSGTQRPVRDYLPGFLAERGQVIVQVPPKLSDVVSSTGQAAGSAISVWTNTVDTTPGGTTKPRQTPTAPTTLTIATEAIVERLKFGNFGARANPEWIAAVMANTAAAWARRAESELLRQIDTNSTGQTTTQVLGATNDFFGYLRQAAAGQRSRHRMPADAQLRCFIPAWFVDFIGADVAHNHPGDGLDRFTVTAALVRSWFAAANVNVTFYEDTATGGGTTDQLFKAVQANSDLQNFPPGPGSTSARVVWYLFPEGTFALADGGTLELGIVRDATLNDTNDYEFFTESWEAVLPRVIESLKVTSTLCTTGAGAIDVTSTAYCTAS